MTMPATAIRVPTHAASTLGNSLIQQPRCDEVVKPYYSNSVGSTYAISVPRAVTADGTGFRSAPPARLAHVCRSICARPPTRRSARRGKTRPRDARDELDGTENLNSGVPAVRIPRPPSSRRGTTRDQCPTCDDEPDAVIVVRHEVIARLQETWRSHARCNRV